MFFQDFNPFVMDGWTNGRTDRRTDRPSFRDARTHLNIKMQKTFFSKRKTAFYCNVCCISISGPKGKNFLLNTGEICVYFCPSIRLSVCPPPSQPASHHRALDGWMDGRMDGRMYAQITSVFYRTSSLLGPLPCLLPGYHPYVDGQGKGIADHIQ